MNVLKKPVNLRCFCSVLFLGMTILRADASTIKDGTGIAQAQDAARTHDIENRVEAGYGLLRMSFIENRGQIDRQVSFYEKSVDHSTYFSKDGVTLALSKSADPKAAPLALRLVPLNANTDPLITGEKPLKGKVNFFIGSDADKWRTQIPSYEAVVYKNLYDNVDLKFYGNNNQLEYDLIVKPGANPSKIELALHGVQAVEMNSGGDLEISLGSEKIIKKKPYIYQYRNGERVEVSGNYKLRGWSPKLENYYVYGFDLGNYDKSSELIIDPVIVYSTFLGGKRLDAGFSIVVDKQGYAYVAGRSQSDTTLDVEEKTGQPPGFPVSAKAFQQRHSDVMKKVGDGIVTKFSIDGTELVYSTFLGGANDPEYINPPNPIDPLSEPWNQSGLDEALTIAIDEAGNAYVAGYTLSSSFPTTKGAFQRKGGGGNCSNMGLMPCADAFVAKLDSKGSKLIYSTLIGGSGQDRATGIKISKSGSVYVSGSTASDNFPVTINAFQKKRGGGCADATKYNECSDIFIAKLTPTGSALVYSTFLGGSRDEQANSLDVDSEGNVYVTGDLSSDDFPTTEGAHKRTRGGGRNTAFVSKLNASGTKLIYSTYLGGNDGSDSGSAIVVDSSGHAYVTGNTSASDFPTTPGVFGPVRHAATDAFITKLNRDGSGLVYSTLLGGSKRETEKSPIPDTFATDIVIDRAGNAYITGSTAALDFPVVNAIITPESYGQGAIVAKIDPKGEKLLFSTLYANEGYISGIAIALDNKGDIYITGVCDGLIPLVKPIIDKYGGGGDAFVAKISLAEQP